MSKDLTRRKERKKKKEAQKETKEETNERSKRQKRGIRNQPDNINAKIFTEVQVLTSVFNTRTIFAIFFQIDRQIDISTRDDISNNCANMGRNFLKKP